MLNNPEILKAITDHVELAAKFVEVSAEDDD